MLARVGSGLNKTASALASSGLSFNPSISTTSTNKCSLRLDCKTSAKASLWGKAFVPTKQQPRVGMKKCRENVEYEEAIRGEHDRGTRVQGIPGTTGN